MWTKCYGQLIKAYWSLNHRRNIVLYFWFWHLQVAVTQKNRVTKSSIDSRIWCREHSVTNDIFLLITKLIRLCHRSEIHCASALRLYLYPYKNHLTRQIKCEGSYCQMHDLSIYGRLSYKKILEQEIGNFQQNYLIFILI